MKKSVVEKSNEMLGKIDTRYDMTIPEIEEIMEYYSSGYLLCIPIWIFTGDKCSKAAMVY